MRPADLIAGSRRWLLAIALIGLLSAGVINASRWVLEARYQKVEIVLDGPDWQALAIRDGLDPAALNSILLTHEHVDHMKGAQVISRTVGAAIFASAATRRECKFVRDGEGITWGDEVTSSHAFTIGSIDFCPFTIPHDGADTFALTFTAEGVKVGVVTELPLEKPSFP